MSGNESVLHQLTSIGLGSDAASVFPLSRGFGCGGVMGGAGAAGLTPEQLLGGESIFYLFCKSQRIERPVNVRWHVAHAPHTVHNPSLLRELRVLSHSPLLAPSGMS